MHQNRCVGRDTATYMEKEKGKEREREKERGRWRTSSVTLSGNTSARSYPLVYSAFGYLIANCHLMQSYNSRTNRHRIDAAHQLDLFPRDLVYFDTNAFVLQLSAPSLLSSMIMPARKITSESSSSPCTSARVGLHGCA